LLKRVSCPALITGRERIDGARNIEIPVMEPDEANEFLDRLIRQASDPSVFAQVDRDRIMTASERTPLVMEWIVGQIDLAQDPDRVLDELAHGGGEAAQRVFDRSFRLPQLGDDGRATVLALSLFAPDASRSALTRVSGFGNNVRRLDEAVKRLARLHLVKAATGGRLTVAGLTRELTKARLSKDDYADDYRKRFVACFLSYAEAHAQATADDYEALEIEKDNLINSMDVASDAKDWTNVIRIGFPSTKFLMIRGYWEQAIQCGKQALVAAQISNDQYHVGAFANHLGLMLASQGDCSAAKSHYELAVEIATRLDAKQGLAATLHQLAILAQDQGELDEARRLYEQSLEINQKLEDQSGIASTLHQLASLEHKQGEIEEARRLYDESLEINKNLGNQIGLASTLHNLAVMAQEQGKTEEARRHYQESLGIKKELGNQSGIASTLHQLAILEHNQGKIEEARQLYDESLEINKKLGNQSGIASTLHQLGGLAENQGKLEEARRLYNVSLEIDKKLGDQNGIASTLHQLAVLAQNQGDLEEARRLYEESLAIAKKLGDQASIAGTLHQLGSLTEKNGAKNEAAQLFRKALEIFEKLGSPKAEIARESLARVEDKSS
jgi:tetratricopeptide (TPR) repeat protein